MPPAPLTPQALHPDVKRRLMVTGAVALLILAAAGVMIYFIFANREIAIDTAAIDAPVIVLAPVEPGRLNAVYVNVGDTVPANTPVALVGTSVLKTKTPGLIVATDESLGAQVGAQDAVVTMVDPSQLRVVGRIDENKGLAQLQVGDPALFTVDAFGSRKFSGIVDEIAPTAHASGIVFNISGSRETQQFDIKVRFDVSAYPELKNGMSARLYIYPQ